MMCSLNVSTAGNKHLRGVVFILISILTLTFVIGLVSAEKGLAAGVNGSRGTINAVVVRSWGGCDSNNVLWDDLNSNWSNYGTTPIIIDYSNDYNLCTGTISYSNLAASGADVVIFSNPVGGGEEYSPEEISAIEMYAQEGHNVIGTFLLLENQYFDNRGLGPIFGLSVSGNFTTTAVVPTYDYADPTNPLFHNMPANYASGGYPFAQVPSDDLTWDSDDLAGAHIVAKTAVDNSVITLFHAVGYSAIYIANMAEYGGWTVDDERFFYNAINYENPFQNRVWIPLVLK